MLFSSAIPPEGDYNPLCPPRDLCCFPVLFLCSFVAERKFLIPRPGILFVRESGMYTAVC